MAAASKATDERSGQCVPEDTTVQRILNQCPEGTYYDANLQHAGTWATKVRSRLLPHLGSNTCTRLLVRHGVQMGMSSANAKQLRGRPPPWLLLPWRSTDGQTAAYLHGYDFGYGYCDPPEGQDCPAGYALSPETGACEPLLQRTLQNGCPEGTAYDEQLGYCAPTSCGCELGTYFDQRSNTCVPYGGEPNRQLWLLVVHGFGSCCELPAPLGPVGCVGTRKYNVSPVKRANSFK